MIYYKDDFVIFSVNNGFIVYNMKKKWKGGHTHIKTERMARAIVNNVVQKQLPKTRNFYLLESHIRVSNDYDYIRKINHLMAVLRQKGKKKSFNNKPVTLRG